MRKCGSPVGTSTCPCLSRKTCQLMLVSRGLWGWGRGWGESKEQWEGSSLWMMDFSSAAVSPSFFPGLTSLTASLGSCFCLFPLLRTAGKVLLDLFHCLPCLMAPPDPSPSRMNSSRRALARKKRNHHQQQELGPTALGRLPHHRTPAARAPGQTLGQLLGVGLGSAPSPLPPIPVWDQPHGSPPATRHELPVPCGSWLVSRKLRVTQKVVLSLW